MKKKTKAITEERRQKCFGRKQKQKLSRMEKSETSMPAEEVRQLEKIDLYLEFQKGSECKDHKRGGEGKLKERVENRRIG